MSLAKAAFILSVLAIVWSIYRVQKDQTIDFNLLDLLVENGRVSKVSCLVMGAFFVTSWIMLDLQFHGKMTEGYMAMYGATWVAPLLVRLFNPPTTSSASTTTTTTKSSESEAKG